MKTQIEIIYQDDNVIAVNKPSGIIVIPDQHTAEDQTLVGILKKQLKQRKLLSSLELKMHKLRTGNYENNLTEQNEIFSLLAGEFREFISFITEMDCRVLAPREFSVYAVAVPGVAGPDFFFRLFRQWDNLRFSGQPISKNEVLHILDELGIFFNNINNNNQKSGKTG